MSTPFLNDAFVRSKLTRKIAALENSTQRGPSHSQVKQLNGLTQTYHGILTTPNMKPETAQKVLSDISQDPGMELQYAQRKQQQMFEMLSKMSKQMHDTSMSIIQNIRG